LALLLNFSSNLVFGYNVSKGTGALHEALRTSMDQPQSWRFL